jgi:hypothetical protein
MVGTQRTHQRPARVSVCPHRTPHNLIGFYPLSAYRTTVSLEKFRFSGLFVHF